MNSWLSSRKLSAWRGVCIGPAMSGWGNQVQSDKTNHPDHEIGTGEASSAHLGDSPCGVDMPSLWLDLPSDALIRDWPCKGHQGVKKGSWPGTKKSHCQLFSAWGLQVLLMVDLQGLHWRSGPYKAVSYSGSIRDCSEWGKSLSSCFSASSAFFSQLEHCDSLRKDIPGSLRFPEG